MNNPLALFNLNLNLEVLAGKLRATESFMNFSLMSGVLHCEHFGWNLDFYNSGRAVISLPKDPISPDSFDFSESITICRQTTFLHQEEHIMVDIDTCLDLANSILNKPLEDY